MGIEPEYWALCDSCGADQLLVDTVPGKGRAPINKHEALLVALKIHKWKRSQDKKVLICPDCRFIKGENDE